MKKNYEELIKLLSEIVEENVESYQYDFYEYDTDVLKHIEPDTTYIWVARQRGTHLSPDPEYIESILECWEPRKIALITLHHNGLYDITVLTPETYDIWSETQRDYYLSLIRDELHNDTVFDASAYTPATIWYDFGYIHINYYGTVAIDDTNADLYKVIKKLHFTAFSFYTFTSKRKSYAA